MDVNEIRRDFPLLNKKVKGKALIYLDSACMSLRPMGVIEAVIRYYTDMSACAGRSNHRLARAVNEATEAARKKVGRFIGGADEREVIMTRNTTEGINLVASGLTWKAGDTVLTSDKEHNSNLVPWLRLKRTHGIKHQVIPSLPDNTLDQEAWERALDKYQPKLVSLVATSNLDGVSYPVEWLIKTAHRAGALVLVDAAQAIPHQPIKVKEWGVDFLSFSGHKMLGPAGTGILYGKRERLEELEGLNVGGDTVEYTTYTDYKHLPLPEKFEGGLQNYSGMMGLGAAVDYLERLDRQQIAAHEAELNRIITTGLSQIKGLNIIGPKDPAQRGGVVSFWVKGKDAHQIALLLDESFGIMVRSGQHCVHSWFNARKIKGSVRASVYLYNTQAEAEKFAEAVDQVVSII